MKLEELKSTITISRNPSYDNHKLRTDGLDIDRVIKFNNFEKIEVTKEELEVIGLHRWLIIEEKEDGGKDIIEN